MHWARQYLGKPWVSGERGPDSFDCWGLVVDVYERLHGINLPPMAGVDAKDRLLVSRLLVAGQKDQDFYRVTEPKEYDVVLMGRGIISHHVGIWTDIDGGGCVHCQDGAGVVFATKPQLAIQHYSQLKYFRHGSMSLHH